MASIIYGSDLKLIPEKKSHSRLNSFGYDFHGYDVWMNGHGEKASFGGHSYDVETVYVSKGSAVKGYSRVDLELLTVVDEEGNEIVLPANEAPREGEDYEGHKNIHYVKFESGTKYVVDVYDLDSKTRTKYETVEGEETAMDASEIKRLCKADKFERIFLSKPEGQFDERILSSEVVDDMNTEQLEAYAKGRVETEYEGHDIPYVDAFHYGKKIVLEFRAILKPQCGSNDSLFGEEI